MQIQLMDLRGVTYSGEVALGKKEGLKQNEMGDGTARRLLRPCQPLRSPACPSGGIRQQAAHLGSPGK